MRAFEIARFAAGEIAAGEAGDRTDGVGDDEQAAAHGEMAPKGGAEAREIARLAAIDEMGAGYQIAPDPARLKDERSRSSPTMPINAMQPSAA